MEIFYRCHSKFWSIIEDDYQTHCKVRRHFCDTLSVILSGCNESQEEQEYMYERKKAQELATHEILRKCELLRNAPAFPQ